MYGPLGAAKWQQEPKPEKKGGEFKEIDVDDPLKPFWSKIIGQILWCEFQEKKKLEEKERERKKNADMWERSLRRDTAQMRPSGTRTNESRKWASFCKNDIC